ncbi:MAG: hypothetical protein K6G15_09530 [Desulfovibrio sp.]|nr:hypothetical protein [Desulfovibrio sp.]
MKLCLCGLGRAGREFVRYLAENPTHELAAVLCRKESATAGKRVCELTEIAIDPKLCVQPIESFDPKQTPVDIIVDFSACATSLKLVDLCCRTKTNLVICPTDFTEDEVEQIKNKVIKNSIGLVFASTLTSGINLVIDFVERLSRVFPDYRFEIIERHPHNKPSPTKTARYIQQAISREEVPISSIRLDGYVGVHEITATDGYERISITHESFSRLAFVRGALLAAEFIQRKRGVFYMKDIVKTLLLDEKL